MDHVIWSLSYGPYDMDLMTKGRYDRDHMTKAPYDMDHMKRCILRSYKVFPI